MFDITPKSHGLPFKDFFLFSTIFRENGERWALYIHTNDNKRNRPRGHSASLCEELTECEAMWWQLGGRKHEKYVVPAGQRSIHTNNCAQPLQNDTEAAGKKRFASTVRLGRHREVESGEREASSVMLMKTFPDDVVLKF